MSAPDVGDLEVLSITFYSDPANTEPADPTAVTLLIRDPSGVVLDASADVVRDDVGVYRDDWSPLVRGMHIVQWSGTGDVQAVDQYGIDVRGGFPLTTDLIDLQTLRSFMRLPIAEDDQDPVLESLITSVSSYFCEAYQQEFAPATSVATPRDFVWRGGKFLDLAPYNAQAGTITSVVLDNDTSTPTTLTEIKDYSEHPSVSPWGIVNYLRLPTLCNYRPIDLAHQNWRRVTITAKWGYPSVPPIVAQAACWTVVHWHRKYVGSRPSSFAEVPEETGVREFAMPYPAVQLMRSFENRSILLA